MKTKTLFPTLFLIFIFLVPVRAQENSMKDIETILKDIPNSFKNLIGEKIPDTVGAELYYSNIKHDKADEAMILLKDGNGYGTMYRINYSYENDPDEKIFKSHLMVFAALKNEGIDVEELSDDPNKEQTTGIRAYNGNGLPLMDLITYAKKYEITIYANDD